MNTIHTEVLWHDMNVPLKHFIAKRVPDESVAEDILQEVFMRIHAHADTLKNADKVESWLYQITRNAIVDYYRSRKDEGDLSEILPASEDDDEDDLAKQLAPCLRGMIEDLPPKYQEALRLTEYEGLTQNALAQRLGISLPGAKSRVQRAKEQLKEILLQCCHFEFDRLGKIIDYRPNCDCCTNDQARQCQTSCDTEVTKPFAGQEVV